MKSALQAVAQLHNRVLEPSERGASSRKASAGTLMWARQVSGEGLHMKKWRLIVRNLAFDVRARPRAVHACLRPYLRSALVFRGVPPRAPGPDWVVDGPGGGGPAPGAVQPRWLCVGADHPAQARRCVVASAPRRPPPRRALP